MDAWRSFLSPADEWFVTYAIIPIDPGFASVTMFCIGHTLELYLKAVVAKHTWKSVDEIIEEYGHNIKALWDACKSDQNFIPNYEIEDSVLNAYLLKGGKGDFVKELNKHDFESYSKHQELYFFSC